MDVFFYAAVLLIVCYAKLSTTTIIHASHGITGTYCCGSDIIEYETADGRKLTARCLGVCRVTRAYCGCINDGFDCTDQYSCCPGLVCVGHHRITSTSLRLKCMPTEKFRQLQRASGSRSGGGYFLSLRPSTDALLSHNFSGISCDNSNPKKLQYEDLEGNVRKQGCLGVCKVREAECQCATTDQSCKGDGSCCQSLQCKPGTRSLSGFQAPPRCRGIPTRLADM